MKTRHFGQLNQRDGINLRRQVCNLFCEVRRVRVVFCEGVIATDANSSSIRENGEPEHPFLFPVFNRNLLNNDAGQNVFPATRSPPSCHSAFPPWPNAEFLHYTTADKLNTQPNARSDRITLRHLRSTSARADGEPTTATPGINK